MSDTKEQAAMTLQCQFGFGQKVRHIYSEFQGHVVGIEFTPDRIRYEVIPLCASDGQSRDSTWIPEWFLVEVPK